MLWCFFSSLYSRDQIISTNYYVKKSRCFDRVSSLQRSSKQWNSWELKSPDGCLFLKQGKGWLSRERYAECDRNLPISSLLSRSISTKTSQIDINFETIKANRRSNWDNGRRDITYKLKERENVGAGKGKERKSDRDKTAKEKTFKENKWGRL